MIKLFILIFISSIYLIARSNPFESSILDEENTKPKLKTKIVKNITNEDDGTRTVKVQAQTKAKIEIKQVPKVIMKKVKKEDSKKELSKEEIAKLCKVENNKKIIKIKKVLKKKEKFVPVSYQALPFVTIDVNKYDLKITSRGRYEIINYINLTKDKKVVFDFYAKVTFSTKSKTLKSPKFSSYKIGNHKEDKFFRVVIKLKDYTKKYTISIKNNVAKIKYKR